MLATDQIVRVEPSNFNIVCTIGELVPTGWVKPESIREGLRVKEWLEPMKKIETGNLTNVLIRCLPLPFFEQEAQMLQLQ